MLQTVLNKLFHKVDILVNGEPGTPIYLRRWFIWPRRPEDSKFVSRVYLHRFYTGDNVRDLHDHPWKFSSIILWGGYWEHSFNPAWLKWRELKSRDFLDIMDKYEPEKTIKKWYGPGSFLKRGASWTHAVELKKKLDADALEFGLEVETKEEVACWSIIHTGIKCRSWGFHTDNGWCWWRNYHSGACVCYDNPNEDINNGRPSSTIDVSQVASGH